MKSYLNSIKKTLLALLGAALCGSASAQVTNTETYFAELYQNDRRDVSVMETNTVYGNSTEIHRYGDDGSAAIVDAAGMVIWRTNAGIYRALPDSHLAKPLFVTNHECVVWKNAYEANSAGRQRMVLSYYRLDSHTSEVVETTVAVDGNVILETPRVTTSSLPFTLVTANDDSVVPTNNTIESTVYVYRLSLTAIEPQLLHTWNIVPEELQAMRFTASAGVDGSYLVRFLNRQRALPPPLDPVRPDDEYVEYLWISPLGQILSLYDASADFNGIPPLNVVDIDPISVSATQLVFGVAGQNQIFHFTRGAGTGLISSQIDSGTTGFSVLPLRYETQKGYRAQFVTYNRVTPATVRLNRIHGATNTVLFQAALPQGMAANASSVVQNLTEGSESLAAYDPNNNGVVWLHNGPGQNLATSAATVNFSLVNAPHGKPLYVTPFELIVWTNGYAPPQPDGTLEPVRVVHYGRAPGGAITVTDVSVLFDGSDLNALTPSPPRGRQVFLPSPYTPHPELWKLETAEKIGRNTLRIRRYHLLNPSLTDADGDGIIGALEVGPFYVIPGRFTYAEAQIDAARRGGRLASIADAAELNRMSTSIDVWRRGSPNPFPKKNVPYPLWIGLENNGSWAWENSATPPGFLPTNWAAGEPSAVPGRNRGQLTSTSQWASANPGVKAGYLLQLAATDPDNADTDGDGVSDYDELFRLLTDPTTPGFDGTVPGSVVNFSNSLVNGNYEGFLTDPILGPMASFTIKVSKKGSFSGRILSANDSMKIRGKLNPDGSLVNLPVKSSGSGTSMLTLGLAPDPITGNYRISGKLTAVYGKTRAFELRRAGYDKANPTSDQGDYTMVIPRALETKLKQGMPFGDGFLLGTVRADGKTKLKGYSADGEKLSWSGNVLEGDFISFYSSMGRNGGFVGSNLFFRDTMDVDVNYGFKEESHLDGGLLVTRNHIDNSPGYTYRSKAYGSIYHRVPTFQLPSFQEFEMHPNNVIVKFVDGIFSNQDVIATWDAKNKLTIPFTQTRKLKAKIKDKTGELKGTYQYNDPANGYATSKGKLAAVVLQRSGEIRGHYTGGTRVGQLEILPNLDGSAAPVTFISPKSKNVKEEGATYNVYLTAAEPWQVRVPSEGNEWISVTPASGTGSAVLTVAVRRNSTPYQRTAEVLIAGKKHRITQAFGTKPAAPVEISPASASVQWTGRSYTVIVENYEPGFEPAGDFASPVDWATVTYLDGIATVTVEENLGFLNRSATLTIAGLPHTVFQSWF